MTKALDILIILAGSVVGVQQMLEGNWAFAGVCLVAVNNRIRLMDLEAA